MQYKALLTIRNTACLWIGCWLLFNLFMGFTMYLMNMNLLHLTRMEILLVILIISAIGSFPVLVCYALLFWVSDPERCARETLFKRLHLFNLAAALFYTGIYYAFTSWSQQAFDLERLQQLLLVFAGLFGSAWCSLIINTKRIAQHHRYNNINKTNMDNTIETREVRQHRIMYKAILTACMILILLIPMIFVNDLVRERQLRRVVAVKDIQEKWAEGQTVIGPYLHIPYKVTTLNSKKEPVVDYEFFILLPEHLESHAQVETEKRKRSIYEVLLYRTAIQNKGQFLLQLPNGVKPEQVMWQEAKICIGISDFIGIEREMQLQVGGENLSLLPGLPDESFHSKGLSALASLRNPVAGQSISFQANMWLKGSEQLHFSPLAGNSSFTIASPWPNPSFDGNSLPSSRTVNKDGFTATWTFNKANLPFSTVVTDLRPLREPIELGVKLVEPADQYAKTERASKYAILLISLCFALFFILEIMQRKPLHPVQYLMVGLALIIFYTLLLSISEITRFDLAYWIAAGATVSLIAAYVYGHFRSIRIAGYFTCLLGGIYGFVYVLLQLEDTALLVGSIGLFLILAASMIASRRVNWYTTASNNS